MSGGLLMGETMGNSAFSRWGKTIAKRDGLICHYCGGKVFDVGPIIRHRGSLCGYDCRTMATIDHIIPKSRGGTDVESNLVIACQSCNAKKKDHYGELLDKVVH